MLRILLEATFSILKGFLLDNQLQGCQFVKESVHRNEIITTIMIEVFSYLFIMIEVLSYLFIINIGA